MGNADFQRRPMLYTKLVFLRITLLIAPKPNANSIPPTAQSATLIIVEPIGVIIETIINKSIPPPRLPHIASQALCFAATLISVNIETKTSIKNIFASIHITRLPALSP